MVHKLIVLIAVLCALFSGSFAVAPPTPRPTGSPTWKPTVKPSAGPTTKPTFAPSWKPTVKPSAGPTIKPTLSPSWKPTIKPSAGPTAKPTLIPTAKPSIEPTEIPTMAPTLDPTAAPTNAPTDVPTIIPSEMPTAAPTIAPTDGPTIIPSEMPTAAPTIAPTDAPTMFPTFSPSTTMPSRSPTIRPTSVPTLTRAPTTAPTNQLSPIVSFFVNVTVTNSYSSNLVDADSRNTVAMTVDAEMGLLYGSSKVINTVPLGRIARKLRSSAKHVTEGAYTVKVMLQTTTELGFYTGFATTTALYTSATDNLNKAISMDQTDHDSFSITLQSNALNNGTPDLFDAGGVAANAGPAVVTNAPKSGGGGGGSSSNGLSGGAVAGIVICVLFCVGVGGYLFYTEYYLKKMAPDAKHSSGQNTVGYSLPGEDDSVAENPVHHTTL